MESMTYLYLCTKAVCQHHAGMISSFVRALISWRMNK